MFVTRSKYLAEKARADAAESHSMKWKINHRILQRKWNDLVERINRKGGEEFLQEATIKKATPQFNADEINKLIMLCHPDKHDGKKMAIELTQKLLQLRETVK